LHPLLNRLILRLDAESGIVSDPPREEVLMPQRTLFSESASPAVLAVTPYPDDARFLEGILSKLHVGLRTAGTVAAALSQPDLGSVPLVVCEHDLPDGTWRDIARDLTGRDDPPRWIVTSIHADERLWAEVLNLGGCDVLAKPLHEGETLRVLGYALQRAAQHAV
jgi:DNA-binding response OmpR family regulator